jgi:fluoride exporter
LLRFLMICLGGAVGTGARYLFSTAVTRALGNFPFGTLGVNVIGSFLTALITTLALEQGRLSEDARLVLTTGVLGGFTTYSAFNFETMRLAQTGTVGLAALNVCLTLFVCFAAGLLGLLAGRALA